MTIPTPLVFRMTSCCALAVLLVACETVPQTNRAGLPVVVAPAVVEAPVMPVDPAVLREKALNDALSIYADGRYDDAVALLTPLLEGPDLPVSFQVKVLKFTAFSHCAMARVRQCRQSFDQAFEVDSTFQLTEAEKGHPVWGREFNHARLAARNKRNVKAGS